MENLLRFWIVVALIGIVISVERLAVAVTALKP